MRQNSHLFFPSGESKSEHEKVLPPACWTSIENTGTLKNIPRMRGIIFVSKVLIVYLRTENEPKYVVDIFLFWS
jgi:hypothetical protein